MGDLLSALSIDAMTVRGARRQGATVGGVTGESDESLNLKQVAARLGVHYMTAYRYVRHGHLEAWWDGTGWRVAPDALASFKARRAEPGSGTTPSSMGKEEVDWAGRIAAALVAQDEVAAWELVERALAAGHDPAFCFIDMIAVALALIDDRSRRGELGPAAWPASSVLAERLIARLGARFRRPGRSRGTIVLGAPTGEQHRIPIAVLADLLRLEGYRVVELGANVSPQAFADAAAHAQGLHAVGIGVTTVHQLDAAKDVIAALRAAVPGVPIVVGGQAVRNGDIASLLDADGWAPDGRSAVTAMLQAQPRRHGSGRSGDQPRHGDRRAVAHHET